MPLYEYQCQACEKIFEVRASIKEKEAGLILVCPKCGGQEARQRLTAIRMLHGATEVSRPVCGPNCGPGCCS